MFTELGGSEYSLSNWPERDLEPFHQKTKKYLIN